MTPPRRTKERVKTAEGRSIASTRWLERQLNDPFVHEAKRLGFRARSVFKLEEIDKRHNLLRKGGRVVDLGAAPGSWSQYAANKGCHIVAIDILPMQSLGGVEIMQGDFLEPAVQDELERRLGGPIDVVLSDIAAPSTGQRNVDRLRAEGMGEMVLDFARRNLRQGGNCLLKLVKGAEAGLVPVARELFRSYRLVKPEATRSESSEIYLLGLDRRAIEQETPPAEA